MTDLVNDLEEMIRTDVLAALGADSSGELEAMSLSRLLIVYLNWRSRFITAVPRAVHLSSELAASPKYSEHRGNIDTLVEKIESGSDLTPHLSKAIQSAYVPVARRKSAIGPRADLDRLRAEWGIHHLHLSSEMDPDGFVKRDDDLLFALFRAKDAFLIGIQDHGGWANTELVRIAVENWPDAGVFIQSRGSIGLSQHFSDEDRLLLRNAGVTTPVEVRGKIYMPPGQSLAGTSSTATTVSNQIMWGLRDLRRILSEPESFNSLLSSSNVDMSKGFTWEPSLIDGFYGLHDARTNTFLRAVVVPG